MDELSHSEQRDWIALTMAKGLGSKGIYKLVGRFGSASSLLDSSATALQASGICTPQQITSLRDAAGLRTRATREISRLEAIGGRPLICGYAPYPELLAQVVDPPPVL